MPPPDNGTVLQSIRTASTRSRVSRRLRQQVGDRNSRLAIRSAATPSGSHWAACTTRRPASRTSPSGLGQERRRDCTDAAPARAGASKGREGEPRPSRESGGLASSGRRSHPSTGLSAASTGIGTGLHLGIVAKRVTVLRAPLADLGADRTGPLVQVRAREHEVRRLPWPTTDQGSKARRWASRKWRGVDLRVDAGRVGALVAHEVLDFVEVDLAVEQVRREPGCEAVVSDRPLSTGSPPQPLDDAVHPRDVSPSILPWAGPLCRAMAGRESV